MAETLTALEDSLLLGGRTLQSRLLVGTGGFSSLALLSEAVAVDGEVIPRAQWEVFRLSEGARVEVLSAMQGG